MPGHFEQHKREVYLEGEAFFRVTKNIQQPFYVYCSQIATHVTGTTFNVKEDKVLKQIEVAVHSGRVEVYKVDERKKQINTATILVPNHRAIYTTNSDKEPVTTLIDVPVLLNNKYNDQDSVDYYYNSGKYFDFKYTSILDIINTLEKAYGISIEVTNKRLYNCHFSGDLSDKGLYEKLDLINKALNTTYEIHDTIVVISGSGCD
ncbi:MAG: FecR family protein [Agriterribacter sp.]